MTDRVRAARVGVWHIALLLPWVIAVIQFKRAFNDNSYLWHVRAGDLQLETGSVLTADPFSFTLAGAPWRTQSWLAELVYSKLDAWNGLAATPWITSTMTVVLFTMLALIVYRRNRSVPSTVLYLVASAVILVAFLNPRPAVFSLPLFAAVVVATHDRRLRWALPLLIWAWAALHGSFAIGIVYIALETVSRRVTRRRVVEMLVIGGSALLTAHGWGVIGILRDFALNRGALDEIIEWRPPDLVSIPFMPLLLGILGLVFLASRGQIKRRDWWIMVPFLILGLSAARAVPQAWIALAPILGRLRLGSSFSTSLLPVPAALGAILILVGPVLVPYRVEAEEGLFPERAAAQLTTDRVFHDDLAGGWLIYQEWPERRIFIDDRAELFGERIPEMTDVRAGLGDWRSVFARDGIEEALLPVGAPLAEILEASGWRVSHEDDAYIVLRE